MVPVMGRIAAGTPIEAIQTRTQTIPMPAEFLGLGDHFALEVRGDSMIEAGIHENDTVVIRKQDSAETGDIVVALIDGEEATLEALAQARRLDRARSRQPRLRDAHLRTRPGEDPRQARQLCCAVTDVRQQVAGPEQSTRRPLLDCPDRPTSWTRAMRRTRATHEVFRKLLKFEVLSIVLRSRLDPCPIL